MRMIVPTTVVKTAQLRICRRIRQATLSTPPSVGLLPSARW